MLQCEIDDRFFFQTHTHYRTENETEDSGRSENGNRFIDLGTDWNCVEYQQIHEEYTRKFCHQFHQSYGGKCQSLLISVKLIEIPQIQVNAVQKTVKTELKSWANVATKNCNQRYQLT